MSEIYFDCTCELMHHYKYQGCVAHHLEYKSISAKEIIELKEEVCELRNAIVDIWQTLEIMKEIENHKRA